MEVNFDPGQDVFFWCETKVKDTFAALIRLSTTTHNLLTFNISEISSKNSEKLRPCLHGVGDPGLVG